MNSALPHDQLMQALAARSARRFIFGSVDYKYKQILFMKGNKDCILVSFSMFKPSGSPPNQTFPDFEQFEIIDYGHGVKLGKYEAAADAIIEDFEERVREGLKAIDKAYEDDGEELCRSEEAFQIITAHIPLLDMEDSQRPI